MNYNYIPKFLGFTEYTAAIPQLYYNVDSNEQRIKALFKQFHKLICFIEYVGNQVNDNSANIEELQELFEKFMESGFNDYYEEQVTKWLTENLDTVFEQYTRGVYFGLNEEGYFTAYIPESWNDVVFDTGADYTLDTYGRLILRMDVDSPYTVEQEPEPNYTTYAQVLEIANNALSLAQTNEQDIGTNDGEIAMLATNTGVSVSTASATSLNDRITALEGA